MLKWLETLKILLPLVLYWSDDRQGSYCKAPLKSMHTSKERYK